MFQVKSRIVWKDFDGIFLNESRPRICLEFSSNFSQTNNRFVKFTLGFSSLIEQFAGNLEFFTIKKKKKFLTLVKSKSIYQVRELGETFELWKSYPHVAVSNFPLR